MRREARQTLPATALVHEAYLVVFKPIVAPIVRSIARTSMKRTLVSLRQRLLMTNAARERLQPVPGT